MAQSQIRTAAKALLQGVSPVLAAVAGISFLFGGGLIHALGSVDRLFGEIIGIGIAFVCLIGMAIAKHVIDDIEWQEANEQATVHTSQENSDSPRN